MRRTIAPPPGDLSVLLHRRHRSNRPEARSEAGRDRDRILYSSAFLRLGSVTQVASAEVGHTFHSRLTHSLKVAQVARRLAERLAMLDHDGAAAVVVAALDADATEACALAHDLGHPPFGHLAEEELNRKAESFGGFEGNAQSFRILTRLAVRSLEDPGLNLTRQTLNGVLKYPWLQHPEDKDRSKKWGAYDADRQDFAWTREHAAGDAASLEARIMDWADDLTYAIHDLDDFFRAGLIPLDDLCRGDDEMARFKAYLKGSKPNAMDAVDSLFAGLGISTRYEGLVDQRAQLRALGSLLITRYIKAFRIVETNEGAAAVEIDDEVAAQVTVLKQLIWFYIIERPSLAVVQAGQRRMVGELVDLYMQALADDKLVARLGPVYAERLEAAETHAARRRVVIDLVAGMTEESALEVYRRAVGVAPGSLLSAPRV